MISHTPVIKWIEKELKNKNLETINETNSVIIIDEDVCRRAIISFALSQRNIHCEPYESVNELIASNPKPGILLINDDQDAVATLIKHLRLRDQRLPILAYSEAAVPERIVEVIRNGALDYLIWPFEAEDIILAIERIEKADPRTSIIRSFARTEDEDFRLTPREREVLAAAAEGLRNREIGRKLQISHRTVEVHRASAFKKIGAKNISEAVHSLFGIRFDT
jgi:FixJ family two-component response regulator